MAKNIAILGSTGSIGVQALDVAKNLGIKVSGLSANSNIELLEKQAREFNPRIISTGTRELADKLNEKLDGLGIEILFGIDGMKKVAAVPETDSVVTSVVGIAGLIPTLEAIRNHKNIALANKETLVTAGSIVIEEAKRNNAAIFPVDSEHSAIYQCLNGNRHQDVKQLILTASGGPFRGRRRESLENVKAADALKHPNWKMGNKITIDSATLMNKGLEVIEAKWLFNMEPDKIKVVIHPQSIIHSMVEYIDGSVMAQLGSPDMKIPIQLALTFPERAGNDFSRLDLLKCGALTFEVPDMEAFPCLGLAFEALKEGGSMPAAMNAANEAAVGLFLKDGIRFTDIPRIIEKIMQKHSVNTKPGLDDIIETDRWARNTVGGLV
ncbi:MAG: 1-deoxy-D-xylulose-5-phosphate reductoisomerase [Ruminiclostridium sp.]|nr:1-deoxy-D-xylulose-5-phosphate reductoisomerase [Ruminiclostridium sp.]